MLSRLADAELDAVVAGKGATHAVHSRLSKAHALRTKVHRDCLARRHVHALKAEELLHKAAVVR